MWKGHAPADSEPGCPQPGSSGAQRFIRWVAWQGRAPRTRSACPCGMAKDRKLRLGFLGLGRLGRSLDVFRRSRFAHAIGAVQPAAQINHLAARAAEGTKGRLVRAIDARDLTTGGTFESGHCRPCPFGQATSLPSPLPLSLGTCFSVWSILSTPRRCACPKATVGQAFSLRSSSR